MTDHPAPDPVDDGYCGCGCHDDWRGPGRAIVLLLLMVAVLAGLAGLAYRWWPW